MKPAVAKKVKEIRNRVRDLKSCFIIQIKACDLKPEQLKDPEQRLIPRVTGLVIREGVWLCNLAERMFSRHDVTMDAADDAHLKDAQAFFKELSEVHSDEISRNLFIYRVDASFVTHMEHVVLLVIKLDAQIKADIAKVAKLEDDGDDAALQEEIDAAMTS